MSDKFEWVKMCHMASSKQPPSESAADRSGAPRRRGAPKGFLADRIVQTIKAEILSGVLPAGARLPTETELGKRFGVSRATVRSAIKELDVLGLVTARQGSGTFVRTEASVGDGLEKMGSISESIQASGKRPHQEYSRRTIRAVTPDEADRMDVPANTDVLELRRRFFADDEIVCYSYDLIPLSIFPDNFDPNDLQGSVFRYFKTELGLHPALGLANVHAIESTNVAWGDESEKHRLFLLLDQLQYDRNNVLIGYSKTYFVEGAYLFRLVRRN